MRKQQNLVDKTSGVASGTTDEASSDSVRSAQAMLADAERVIERADELGRDAPRPQTGVNGLLTVRIWGVPLARVGYRETLDLVDRLIERGRPAFFITANLHYAMLADRDKRLRAVNQRAAFIVADGMPMVWYSRMKRQPLPERVAGSDLIYMLAQRARERGHKMFLLGGAPGIGQQAAENLCRKYPGLQIVGIESPMISDLSPLQHAALIARVRRAKPDLLLVAFGQPKGELWLAEHCEALGVPACVQLGASFDFAAGRVRRAPKWVQRTGLEWLYRISREPKRMIPRYFSDAVFLAKATLRDAAGVSGRRS